MLSEPVQRSVRRVWVQECETNGLWHEETAICRQVKWLHASISEVNSFMAICSFWRNAQSNTSTASWPNSLRHRDKRDMQSYTGFYRNNALNKLVSIYMYINMQNKNPLEPPKNLKHRTEPAFAPKLNCNCPQHTHIHSNTYTLTVKMSWIALQRCRPYCSAVPQRPWSGKAYRPLWHVPALPRHAATGTVPSADADGARPTRTGR